MLNENILKKTNKGAIISTGQVGYFVHLTAKILETLTTDKAEFFIHHNIKEDASDLYGFTAYEDLEFFKQLLSVNGIGPKVALEILNTDPEKIKSAILSDDQAFICTVPGIGKKTAQRLIIELKDKVTTENLIHSTTPELHSDAIEALLKLGYHRHHITRTIKAMPQEIEGAEEIITFFLKNA